jgi:hypothetical protein
MANMDLVDHILKGKSPFTESLEDTAEDSCFRLACCAILQIAHFIIMRHRLKKPFNPILGETYEYVCDKYRFFGEQVSHHPPVSAFEIETEGFKMEAFS